MLTNLHPLGSTISVCATAGIDELAIMMEQGMGLVYLWGQETKVFDKFAGGKLNRINQALVLDWLFVKQSWKPMVEKFPQEDSSRWWSPLYSNAPTWYRTHCRKAVMEYPRILIIEDEIDRRFVRIALEAENFDVIEADNGCTGFN